MNLAQHEVKDLPSPPNFKKLLGPSFILLGLGLGSGEIILWPYLSANYGLGIIWGALLGITLQFFINMEVERYALVRGESIFVGFARKLNLFPIWFIVSTFSAWFWPGIVGTSAKLIGSVVGLDQTKYLAVALLVLIGLILTLGPVLYKTVEKFTFYLILLGVPLIFILTLLISDLADWGNLAKGIVGIGNGYKFLPFGISIASFLGAFAFAGAGGNLNLAQSFYIKEKGYGMGKFSGRITSVLTGKKEEIKLTGTKFPLTRENLKKFSIWWRLINREHAIVFWATGAFTICMLSLLSFSTIYPVQGVATGVNFVILESQVIGAKLFPFVGTLFLIITGLMLFQTQLTVFDATSRIMSENLLLLKVDTWSSNKLPIIYYSFLWLQIIFGICIFLFSVAEPLFLVTVSAVINALAMFVYIALLIWNNTTSLEKPLRPSIFRILILVFAFLFFGFFVAKLLNMV